MLLERLNPDPQTMARIRAITSILPLTLPLMVVRAANNGFSSAHPDWWAFFPLIAMYGVLTIVDYVIGRDLTNTEPPGNSAGGQTWFRLMPLLCVPLHLAMLVFAAHFFATAPLSICGKTGWILSIGAISGIIAINVAHELIHKPTRLEQWAGGILLASSAYGSFKIEHVLGHHLWVGTDRDPSSARRGENVYTFVPRAIWRNIDKAFHLQHRVLARKQCGFFTWRNELFWWYAGTAGFAAALGGFFGASAVLFFAGQAVVAIATLEIINYVEHYGLRRDLDERQRPASVTPMHSWNSAYFLSNAYLFQLQRHSDHHAAAARPYQALQHHAAAPQLPGGYGAMVLLALVPPLWRRVIDPRIPKDLGWQT